MKLTYEAYKEVHSIETERDNLDLDEVMRLVEQLLMSAGFAPENIKEYFEGDL